MNIALALVLVVGLALVASLAFIYSGIYNVTATEPHAPLTR